MADVHTVIESYAEYIETLSKRLWRRFHALAAIPEDAPGCPESAISEAVTFRVLQQCGAKPAIADILNKSGPDFLCMGGTKQQFMVEATSFLPRKITDDAALQNSAPDDIGVQSFSLLTRIPARLCTGTISAVILIAVMYGRSQVSGAINPAAKNKIDTSPLWEIPFVYLPKGLAHREPEGSLRVDYGETGAPTRFRTARSERHNHGRRRERAAEGRRGDGDEAVCRSH